MRRFGLRDDQWERIKNLLPGREGSVGVTAADNRQFVEAVLYRYRTGMLLEVRREAEAIAATAAGVWNALKDDRGVVHGEYVTPSAVQAAYREANKRVAAVGQWRRAADALRADPDAVVSIAIEPMPDPPAPPVIDNTKAPAPAPPTMRIMTPIRRT